MPSRIGILVAFLLCAGPAIAQTRVSTNDFVTQVAMSDLMEIQSSQLALDRQPDADTKPFAERMIKDHQQTSKELKVLVDTGKVKVSLPAGLDSEHRRPPAPAAMSRRGVPADGLLRQRLPRTQGVCVTTSIERRIAQELTVKGGRNAAGSPFEP